MRKAFSCREIIVRKFGWDTALHCQGVSSDSVFLGKKGICGARAEDGVTGDKQE